MHLFPSDSQPGLFRTLLPQVPESAEQWLQHHASASYTWIESVQAHHRQRSHFRFESTLFSYDLPLELTLSIRSMGRSARSRTESGTLISYCIRSSESTIFSSVFCFI